MSKNPLCIVPYSQAFIRPDGQYRNCCSTTPHVIKFEKNFSDWWQGEDMDALRNSLQTDRLPDHCKRCSQSELTGSSSMRTAVGKANASFNPLSKLPNRYQIAFGNLCNLGCWTCEESLSSVIQEEKRRLNILPVDYVDPSIQFMQAWPSLRNSILASYDEHAEVLINIWGGEPSISKEFVEFLELLVEKGLSSRTRIEMFSNCYSPKEGFQELLKNNTWAHITILASIDAVGDANDWVRYGSTWNKVYANFVQFKDVADYLEIQSTLSVLNAQYLPELNQFAHDHNVPLTPVPLQDPWYLSVSNWDGNLDLLGSKAEYIEQGLEKTWDLFGSTIKVGAKTALKDYIQQFTSRTVNPGLQQYLE
jgi:MoaA/NifB/PqqE/SkfB family radical SAM enzyme